jgi:protein RecA
MNQDKIYEDLLDTFGKSGSMLKEKPLPEHKLGFLSTGSGALDYSLGGGIPYGRLTEIFGWQSTGKALPNDTPVMTPDGWSKISDLKIGDYVFSKDGSKTKVTGVFNRGKRKCYNFIFDDGSEIESCEDHLWYVKGRRERLKEKLGTGKVSKKYGTYKVMSTNDIIDYGGLIPKEKYRVEIPLVEPIKFNKQKVSIDPYLLGLLIGGGHLADYKKKDSTGNQCVVKLTTADVEIPKFLGSICRKDACGKYSYTISGMCDKLRNVGLLGKKSYEKFVPREYLFNNINVRLEILRGLMDSDGHCSVSGFMEYSTTSKQLSENVKFIVLSLGGKCKVTSRYTFYTHKGVKKRGRLSYRVIINFNNLVPFRLKRKVDRYKFYKRGSNGRRLQKIVSIKNKKEVTCISVAHKSKLFVTKDFIVTHNSIFAANLLASCQKNGGVGIMLDTENSMLSGWSKKLGIDDSKLLILDSDYLEDAFDKIELACEFAKRNKVPACLVVDSLSVLGCKKQFEAGKTEDTKALASEARIVSTALRKINKLIWNSKVALILVSQVREKIGIVFGNPETTPHGNAVKFYSSVRLKTANTGFIHPENKKSEDPIGMSCRVSIVKNKMDRPRSPVEVEISYSHGIDKVMDTITLGIKLDSIVFHKGGFFEYKGQKLRIKQFKEYFNKELEDGSMLKDITKPKVVEEEKK